MTQILAISAKKGGGKTTATNFIFGLEMVSLQLIDYFKVNDEGKLLVPSRFDDGTPEGRIEEGVFDPLFVNEASYEYLATNIWPAVKQYNFADPIKKSICIGMFGLSYNQCYGTDEEKNQPTHLRWEDMPGVVTNKKVAKDNGLVYHEPGFMSCRELMQFIGTEIFRKMSGNVWVDTTIRLIQAESPRLALIGDCRFPNEVEGIQKAGGKVIRFTRNPFPNDKHPSETALDKENFDWSRFDYVLDNEKMDINTQNNELYKVLNDMGMLQYTMEFNNATSAVG